MIMAMSERSLATLGMTALPTLAQCDNSMNIVIPSEARDLLGSGVARSRRVTP
jgi:hypothetical protein